MKLVQDSRGHYFDTYKVFTDDYAHKMGMIEYHLRGVTSPYVVTWTHKEDNPAQWTTDLFDDEQAALAFIAQQYERKIKK